ncbi:hypothetical protein EDD17DRAFT_1475849 [Pisolithus thermaeus]|nr:hypothetical protein EDD17DRAFT_1475849 [Pisolithus thermaeus]
MPSGSDIAVHEPAPCSVDRRMGDTELSYYLPARSNGVNDMYLHIGFDAPAHLVQRPRVRLVWAILRMQHPLLSCSVAMHSYEDVRFVYTPPLTPQDALDDADNNLEYKPVSKDELIGDYLNGERTLSNQRLSYLIIADGSASLPTPPLTPQELNNVPDTDPNHNHDLLICAAHFLGDGMALHQFANEFFRLLASDKSLQELETLLTEEWNRSCRLSPGKVFTLPNCLEDNLAPEPSKLRRAIGKVDFQLSQAKCIGGQAFPRKSQQPRRTIVPTVSYDADRTKSVLKRCKENGVSISAAFFAICNIAWVRVGNGLLIFPTSMMYSALNLRPYFKLRPPHDSYWFLAVGYFNVVLPNFIPRSIEPSSTFWHRARSAKFQSAQVAKTPMFVSRCRLMAEERGRRARMWAKEDDERERGTYTPPAPAPTPAKPTKPSVPSSALIGLSLLGNLDGIYKHATFPTVKLHTLTTGSRQRSGGMLLFGYTFAGKLWVSLGYDENGFDKEVVERFWQNVLDAMDEFL